MDFLNNYEGSSDEEENTPVNNSTTTIKVNSTPETGFDVSFVFIQEIQLDLNFSV